MALRGDLQREPREGGRAISAQGLEGLYRGPAPDPEWTDKDNQKRYSTEVVLQRYRGELTLLDGRDGGGRAEMGADDMGGAVGYDRGGSGGGGMSRGGGGGGMGVAAQAVRPPRAARVAISTTIIPF